MALLAARSTTPTVTPAEVRRSAHRAACAMHADSGGPELCQLGADISAAVLADIAEWLRNPTSGAAQTVLDALREDATTNPLGSPLTGVRNACAALADLLDGAS